ncbi:MAG: trypsin-like peptidase domain-containing protein, partial [Gammaproteobacteria bacterium]|nr:trypsin-like peptidase domain-containing protein [Gammaproteobacteria bacterium]
MMISKTTIVWRSIVLGLLAVAVPLGMLWQDRIRRVDVDSMLDVSVSIKTISHVRVDSVGDSVWQSASGSGFLVSANDCEVWTNHHVIADAAVIEVYPRHWRRAKGIPATVINSSPRTDFALLRMQNCDGLTAARLGVSGTLQAGDEVYAVGNPLGSNPDSISRGIVSHANRYLFGAVPYIQTDAAINRGNSGGALFNRRGDVIGVNTAIMSMGQAPVGIGYALPVDIVKREAIRLHAGPPSWGQAGIADVISDLTPEQASVFGVPNNNAAVVLTQTPTDGPSVGKLISRDVIYQIENVEITDTEQLKRLISSHEAGQVISLQ